MGRYHRESLCSIYRITNTVDGKVYVGQTWKTLQRRWREHRNSTSCRKLARAIKAHGRESFKIELLTFAATQPVADHLESHFINLFDSIHTGYNIREGGAQGSLPPETKARMRVAHLGKTIFPVQREKARVANLGKKHGPPSKETRAKLRAAALGRRWSDEDRARLSEAHLGKTLSPEHVAAQNEGKRLSKR